MPPEQQTQMVNFQWHPEPNIGVEPAQYSHQQQTSSGNSGPSGGQMQHLDLKQQQQYALSQQQAMMLMNQTNAQSPASPNTQQMHQIFQPQSSPALAQGSTAMFVNNSEHPHHPHHQPTNSLLNAQMATNTNQTTSLSSQHSQLPRQQPVLPFGYNPASATQQLPTAAQQDLIHIQQQLQQRLLNNAKLLSQGTNAAPESKLGEKAGFDMISGVQLASGQRQPNFQINKHLKQQVQGTTAMQTAANFEQNNEQNPNDHMNKNKQVMNNSNNGHAPRSRSNQAHGQPTNFAGQQKSQTSTLSNKHQKAAMQINYQQHHQVDGGHGKPPAQQSANLNLMRQLYSAKGGVQTPPANFKGSSSSVESRRQSGESSGMMSVGSIGTNFNEGNDVVQKPLVREFKTQGRLNRGIMPATNSQDDRNSTTQSNNLHNEHAHQRKSGGTNAAAAPLGLAKKASPRQVTHMANSSQPQTTKARHAQNRGTLDAPAARKDTTTHDKVQVLSQQQVLSSAEEGQIPGVASKNNLVQQPHQLNSVRANGTNTKKFKSVSESNATGSAMKSHKHLMKGVMKGGNNNPHPSFAQQNNQNSKQNVDQKAESGELEFEHPEQPQEDLSPPDLSTFKSQTLPMHNSEGDAQQENMSNISPQKVSFQHSSSNQDAIERNEELMSLLACLNEQAIKELNQQDESEWETGMQRLLKAYKIMVETKNPNSFDANYKAIICYNLACCCQMQSELQDCSKYLTKAIEFVSVKLDNLKEQALSQYTANVNQQIHSNSLEQQSLTVTNSSLTTTTIMQKNSDLFDQRKQVRGSNNHQSQATAAGKNSSVTPTTNRNQAQGQSSAARGSRYTATGKQATPGVYGSAANNGNQRGSQQTRQLKSPLRAPAGASEKQIRTTPAGNRGMTTAQTQNSLYNEFNRATGTAGGKHKGAHLQTNTRTASVNANNQKVRGIGASGQKNVQSHTQFSKPTGLFNAGGLGSNVRSGKQAMHHNSSNQQSNLTSAQRRREAQNNYTAQQQHLAEPVGGHNGSNVNQGGKKGTMSAGVREPKKTSKVQKTPSITVENWLDCFNRTSNRPTREILERSIHLTRYHCRFVLQLCAVLSQLNEHEQALSFSKKASGLATQLTEMTLILIKDETRPAKVNQDNSGIGEMSTQKPKRRKHSTSNQLDPYNTSLSKQKTTVSARFANHGTKGVNSQNSSLVQSNLNQFSKDKVSQSYTMSNFHQLGACKEPSALNNSGMALSYFPNPEQIKNERESLERIHTFSLKEPIDFNGSDDQIGAQTLTGNFLDPLFGSHTDRALRGADGDRDKHNLSMDVPFTGTRQRGISEGSRNSSTTSNRSCSQYVPEKVKIFQKQISRTHDIVNELIEIQKEFFKISEWNFKERRDYFQDRMAEKKKLKISFQTFEEMNKLQIEQKFKITARSALGVKNYGTDDWIFSFNIGNIMHLQTLGFDELANAKTTQSMMKGTDSKRNEGLLKAGIQGSVTTQQGIRNYLMSEISKDQLLYKALYVIVSYFCIGTELRFLATLNPQKYSLKDSEIWHAKAIHIASYFLPNDCPLIQHITQSYAKHHLRPKIKRRQDQLAVLANQ